MSKDRMQIDPDMFGFSVELPTIPVRVAETKTEVKEATQRIDLSAEEPEAKPATGWRAKLAKLHLRPNA